MQRLLCRTRSDSIVVEFGSLELHKAALRESEVHYTLIADDLQRCTLGVLSAVADLRDTVAFFDINDFDPMLLHDVGLCKVDPEWSEQLGLQDDIIDDCMPASLARLSPSGSMGNLALGC